MKAANSIISIISNRSRKKAKSGQENWQGRGLTSRRGRSSSADVGGLAILFPAAVSLSSSCLSESGGIAYWSHSVIRSFYAKTKKKIKKLTLD